MIELNKCFKYSQPISKLTKANSILVDERVIYIVKKDHTGKACGLYIAYDYETKIQLAFNKKKDELIEYLKSKNLKDISWI